MLKTLRFSAVCFLCISAKVSVSAGGGGRVAWPWNVVRLESFGECLVLSGSVQGTQNLGQEIILAQVPAGLWPLRESSNKGKLHLLLATVLPERNDVTGAHRTVWQLLGGSESLFEFFNKMLWKNLLANSVRLLLGLKDSRQPLTPVFASMPWRNCKISWGFEPSIFKTDAKLLIFFFFFNLCMFPLS